MKIVKLHYNWFYSAECGEDYQVAEVGENEVVSIESFGGEIDISKTCYAIRYSNGNIERIYNPNKTFLTKK